jgi:hypothetical protein
MQKMSFRFGALVVKNTGSIYNPVQAKRSSGVETRHATSLQPRSGLNGYTVRGLFLCIPRQGINS